MGYLVQSLTYNKHSITTSSLLGGSPILFTPYVKESGIESESESENYTFTAGAIATANNINITITIIINSDTANG
jgi:hypothetical protein